MNALDCAIAAINHEAAAYYEPSQLLVAAKCCALMRGYDAKWQREEHVVEVERTLIGQIINPETNRSARVLSQAGKIDVIAERPGGLTLIDHKTTSMDITDPDAPYWRQLVVDSQVSHYMLLGWLNAIKFHDAVWDVIRKPSISPKKIAKKVRESILHNSDYCDQQISDATLEYLQTEDRENLELYEARLAHDCTHERPERYFQRRSVPRLDAEILEYASELWQHGKDLLHERKRELPVRNSGACMNYGTACQFLGVCSGHDEITSDHWRIKESVHNELPSLDGDGRNTLTHSRIRCFQTCRRKHYYQYDLGVERYDAEDKESLFFGSLMHVALEAWFLFHKESSNGENATGSPVIEAGKHATADTIAF